MDKIMEENNIKTENCESLKTLFFQDPNSSQQSNFKMEGNNILPLNVGCQDQNQETTQIEAGNGNLKTKPITNTAISEIPQTKIEARNGNLKTKPLRNIGISESPRIKIEVCEASSLTESDSDESDPSNIQSKSGNSTSTWDFETLGDQDINVNNITHQNSSVSDIPLALTVSKNRVKLEDPIQLGQLGGKDIPLALAVSDDGVNAQENLALSSNCDTLGDRDLNCTPLCDRFDHQDSHVPHLALTVPNNSTNIFKCHVCGKAFSCLSSLGRHIKIHAVDNNYNCVKCLRQFSDESDLKRHFQIHLADKEFICGLCNKSFNKNEYLLKHMIIHQRLYKCEVCDKSFASSCHLDSHVRIHTGEKPYNCDVCSKSFALRSRLLNHIVVHTGEKPYSCPVCEKRFADRSTMGRHFKNHKGTTEYKCLQCDKTYGDSSNLKRHMKNHGAAERKYTCELCKKSFMENFQLNRHLKMHERLKKNGKKIRKS